MTAGAELQAAIVSATDAIGELKGVFEGPPARADFPYLVVDCGTEKAWNCRLRDGREVVAQLTLWDDHSARLMELEESLQDCALSSRELPNWRVSSLALLDKKKVRSADGPWASHLTLRVRLMKTGTEPNNAES